MSAQFTLPCGHKKEWIGFDVFDVVNGRVACNLCLMLDMQKRLGGDETEVTE